tara:strand:- start:30697 stop:31761 length:1065 start_codon:yes stop_codon:yes gene_type:complete
MAEVYKRLYELTISESVTPNYEIPPSIVAPEFEQENFDKATSINQMIVTELAIEAMITKNKGTSVDQLDLSVYNMSNEAHSLLESDGAIIILKAGYESLHKDHSGLPTVFMGQVDSFEVTKSGNNTITRIIAGDGLQMLKNERLSYEAPAGTPVVDVIRDMASRFRNISEVVLGYDDLEGEVFETGYSAYGLLKAVFRELCESRGLTFNFRNNSIVVHPESWIIVTPVETGIIDPFVIGKEPTWETTLSKAQDKLLTKDIITVFPEQVIRAKKLTEKKATKTSDGKATYGLLLEIPIQTEIDINRSTVRLENSENNEFDEGIAADYTIESIEFSMQLRNGDWCATLELTRKGGS